MVEEAHKKPDKLLSNLFNNSIDGLKDQILRKVYFLLDKAINVSEYMILCSMCMKGCSDTDPDFHTEFKGCLDELQFMMDKSLTESLLDLTCTASDFVPDRKPKISSLMNKIWQDYKSTKKLKPEKRREKIMRLLEILDENPVSSNAERVKRAYPRIDYEQQEQELERF